MILGLAGPMLAILAAFLVLSAAFCGIGLLQRLAFTTEPVDLDDCFLAFWTGYGWVLLFLVLWNFILPVGLPALGVTLVLGGAGLVLNRAGLRDIARHDSWRPGVAQTIVLVGAALWVANLSMAGFDSWDGGLYHLQSVQWAEAYPVVPGIANLHGPLAFNNASFLYDAMLDSGWWSGRAFHVANGLLFLVGLVQVVSAGGRLAAGRSGGTAPVFRFLQLAPILNLNRNGNLTSYSTDVPATLVLLAATAAMYDLVGASADGLSARQQRHRLVAVATLFSAAVCIKLTAGVFAAVAVPIAALLWWKRHADRRASTIAWATIVPLVFAIPWMARGVVMSGYPLFPLPVAGLPVDWRAPVEHAAAEMAYVGFTERGFTWRIIGRGWLRLVLLMDVYAVLVPTCLAAGAAVWLHFGRRTRYRAAPRDGWWLLVPPLAAIAAWISSAPSTRYSPALFWGVAAVCVCQAVDALGTGLADPRRRVAIAAAAILGVAPVIVPVLIGVGGPAGVGLFAKLRDDFVAPGSDHGFHGMAEHVTVTPFTTASGLTVNVPAKSADPRVFSKPWDAPIPCTPNPAPNLRLRQQGTLAGGFSVDGAWQMKDWPYYWEDSFLPEWRARRAVSLVD